MKLRAFKGTLAILVFWLALSLYTVCPAEILTRDVDDPGTTLYHRITTFSEELPETLAQAVTSGGFTEYTCYSGTMIETLRKKENLDVGSHYAGAALLAMEKDGERILLGLDWSDEAEHWHLSNLGKKALLQGREFTILPSLDRPDSDIWARRISFLVTYPEPDGGQKAHALAIAHSHLWYVRAYESVNASGEGILISNIYSDYGFRVWSLPMAADSAGTYYPAYLPATLAHMESIQDFPTSEADAKRMAEASWARFKGTDLAMAYGNVNLREKPTTSSTSLGRVRSGVLLHILGQEKGKDAPWYHVRLGREEGWISGVYVRFPNPENPDFGEALWLGPVLVARTLTTCTLRVSPSATTGTVAELQQGALMHVIAERDDGWLYVMIPRGDIGWEMDVEGTSGYVRAEEVLQGASVDAVTP